MIVLYAQAMFLISMLGGISVVCIIISLLVSFSISALTDSISLKSEWHQVSSSLRDISKYSGQF